MRVPVAALRATVVVALLGALAASPTRAGIVTLTGGTLGVDLGFGLQPPPVHPNAPVAILLTASGGFTEPAGVFGPATVTVHPGLMTTGLPQISGITLAGLANGTKTVTCSVMGCAGTGGLAGKAIINVLQLVNLTIPLSVVGQSGASTLAMAGGIIITVVGQGWTSGTAAVGAVTSTTPATAVLHTVTRMGSDSRTGNGSGQLTLVSGFQAVTNVAGTLPGFATQILRFSAAVPEPATLLLVGAGAGALILLGRRRR